MKIKENYNKEILPGNANPFVSPNGYFDSFSERLMNRIDLEEAKIKPKSNVRQLLRPILTMAASLLILFCVIYFPIKHYSNKVALVPENNNRADLSYMDYYIINDRAILEAFAQDSVNQYDQAVVETYLLASVSDIELMELNN